MNVLYRDSFLKDIKNCNNKSVKRKMRSVIIELEEANQLSEISQAKKLKGYKTAFRIRVGDFRIGLDVAPNRVELVRLLHRKDIYKFFP